MVCNRQANRDSRRRAQPDPDREPLTAPTSSPSGIPTSRRFRESPGLQLLHPVVTDQEVDRDQCEQDPVDGHDQRCR